MQITSKKALKHLGAVLSGQHALGHVSLSNLIELQKLAPLHTRYLPWTSSAIEPAALTLVLNDIIVHNRTHLVEFGCGISTLFIARILDGTAGHLYSIENDVSWAAIIEKYLTEEGLSNYVTLIHAPLVESPNLEKQNSLQETRYNYLWYDTSILEHHLPPHGIDMVLIDGPAAYSREFRHARYPALPYIYPRLNIENHCIFLDDANRQGEKAVVREWEQKFNYSFQIQTTRGNIALATKGATFNI